MADADLTLVLPDDVSGRLDAALSRLLPEVSRRRLKEAFHAGRVAVEGRRAKGADPARPGAKVVLRGLAAGAGAAPDLPALVVVHEDEALIVVDKPEGVPAYPLRPGEGGTVAEAVLARHPDLEGVGDLPLAPGLAHRLDRETSGLLVFARTPAAFEAVRAAFRRREVHKTYLAVVAGALEGEGTIDVPLGRRRGDRKRVHPVPTDDPAIRTVWPALTRWRALAPAAGGTLVEVDLVTGVTHQARVHLAWLGHPILGDPRYGGPEAPRLMLHAARLALPHPVRGGELRLASPATFP